MRPHDVVVRETITRRYRVDAANKHAAAFLVATGIALGELEPTQVMSTSTSTSVSTPLDEDDGKLPGT